MAIVASNDASSSCFFAVPHFTFLLLVVACTRRQVASFLINALIALYVDDNAATDAISQRLREVCPSLYSVEDALCSKVSALVVDDVVRYISLPPNMGKKKHKNCGFLGDIVVILL